MQSLYSQSSPSPVALSLSGVPAGWKVPQSPPSSPVMTMRLRKGDLSLDFFSKFTTFAMPHEVALQH